MSVDIQELKKLIKRTEDYPVVLIAGYDTPTEFRSIADYVCDGKNDEVEINKAIHEKSQGIMLNENIGRNVFSIKILFLPGTYVIEEPILLKIYEDRLITKDPNSLEVNWNIEFEGFDIYNTKILLKNFKDSLIKAVMEKTDGSMLLCINKLSFKNLYFYPHLDFPFNHPKYMFDLTDPSIPEEYFAFIEFNIENCSFYLSSKNLKLFRINAEKINFKNNDFDLQLPESEPAFVFKSSVMTTRNSSNIIFERNRISCLPEVPNPTQYMFVILDSGTNSGNFSQYIFRNNYFEFSHLTPILNFDNQFFLTQTFIFEENTLLLAEPPTPTPQKFLDINSVGNVVQFFVNKNKFIGSYNLILQINWNAGTTDFKFFMNENSLLYIPRQNFQINFGGSTLGNEWTKFVMRGNEFNYIKEEISTQDITNATSYSIEARYHDYFIILKTPPSLSGITLDGIQLSNITPNANITIRLNAGSTLTINWTTSTDILTINKIVIY